MTTLSKLAVGLALLAIMTACSTLPQQDDAHQDKTTVNQADEITTLPRPSYDSLAEDYFVRANGLRQRDPEQAIALYQMAIKQDPAIEPAYYNLAKLCFTQDNDAVIDWVMQTASSNAVSSARLLTLHGVVLRQRGDFQKAQQAYSDALQLAADYPPALVNLAILSDIYLQDLATAKIYYEQYQATLTEDSDEADQVNNWLADLNLRLNKKRGDE